MAYMCQQINSCWIKRREKIQLKDAERKKRWNKNFREKKTEESSFNRCKANYADNAAKGLITEGTRFLYHRLGSTEVWKNIFCFRFEKLKGIDKKKRKNIKDQAKEEKNEINRKEIVQKKKGRWRGCSKENGQDILEWL